MKDIEYSKRTKIMVVWTVAIGLITCGAILFGKHLLDIFSSCGGVLIAFLGIVVFMTAPCLFAVLSEEQYQSYEDYQEYTSKQEYERREKGEQEMVNIKPSQTPPMPEVKPPKVPPTDFEKMCDTLVSIGCEYETFEYKDGGTIYIDTDFYIDDQVSISFNGDGSFRSFSHSRQEWQMNNTAKTDFEKFKELLTEKTDFEKFKELLTEVGCEYTIWFDPDDISIEISVEFDRKGKFKGFVTG